MKSNRNAVTVSRAEPPAKQQKNSPATTPATEHVHTANTQPAKPLVAPKQTLAEVLAGLGEGKLKKLTASVSLVKDLDDSSVENFYTKVGACAKMREILDTAYAAYIREQLGYEKAHAHRLAGCGGLIDRWSPHGDDWKVLSSEAHFRPLLDLILYLDGCGEG